MSDFFRVEWDLVSRGGSLGMDDVEVRIHSIEHVGPETVAIAFETPQGFDAAAGQHVELSALIDGELVKRHYTLSSPGVDATFEITVSIDPEGTLAPWLADRGPGETVQISGPYGDAYYEGEDRAVVLAAGPGIGPAIAIGESAISDGGSVAIVYPESTNVHENRLTALADAGAHVIAYADEVGGIDDVEIGESEDVENGAVDEVEYGGATDVGNAAAIESAESLESALAAAVDRVDGRIFAYGFADFVTAVVEAMESIGLDPDEGKIESFGPRS